MKLAVFEDLQSFLLGACFVVAYAIARMRGPEADRSYTTTFRYTVSAFYYSLGHLAVYALVLCLLLGVSIPIKNVPGERNAFLDYLFTLPAWLALLSACILPRIKPFSVLDTMFRAHARHIGGMPQEALQLRDPIAEARLRISDEDAREIHYSLLRRGVDIGSHLELPDDTLHAQVLKSAQLKFIFDRAIGKRRHRSFARDNTRAIENLSRRFDKLMFRVSRHVEAIGRLHELANTVSCKTGNWEALGALAENQAFAPESMSTVIGPTGSTSRMLIVTLRDDLRVFINHVSLMLARMTLRKRWTERGRVRALARLGIPIEPLPRPRFSAMIVVFLAVSIGMLWMFETLASPMRDDAKAALAIMVSINTVIAVLCAVYPKQYFSFANPDIYGRKPHAFYFIAAFTAAALAFAVGLLFRFVRGTDGESILTATIQRSPWLLYSFCLALVLAMLVQDTQGARGSERDSRRAWRDAVVLGLALGVTMFIIQVLLQLTNPGYSPLRLELVALGVYIGAFIGFYVPKRFRNVCPLKPSHRHVVEEAAPGGPMNAAWRFMKGSAP